MPHILSLIFALVMIGLTAYITKVIVETNVSNRWYWYGVDNGVTKYDQLWAYNGRAYTIVYVDAEKRVMLWVEEATGKSLRIQDIGIIDASDTFVGDVVRVEPSRIDDIGFANLTAGTRAQAS